MSLKTIQAGIRDVPDFPKEGIVFKDITTLLADPTLFRECVDLFYARHKNACIDTIAIVEARGFIFGSALAYKLGTGIVPIRKQGKLPYETLEASYELEYGSATLQIHVDAFEEGAKVLLIDDLLATGGTAAAAAQLIEDLKGTVVEIDFLIELGFLKGRDKLVGYEIFAPVVF